MRCLGGGRGDEKNRDSPYPAGLDPTSATRSESLREAPLSPEDDVVLPNASANEEAKERVECAQ